MEIRERMVLRGDVVFMGRVVLPADTVGNDQMKTGSPLETDRTVHRHVIHYDQADGADVAAAIVPIHTAAVAGTVSAVQVVCLDCPEGGDKHFTVDLAKCNAGTPAPASILTTAVDCAAATPDATVLEGDIDDEDLAAGDTLVVVIAVAGSTGNQGQGLVVTITVDEEPV